MPLCAVLLTALIVLLATHNGGQKTQNQPDVRVGTVSLQDQKALATRFRPRLFFDRKERWRPLNVRSFFAESAISGQGQRLCSGSGQGGQCPVLSGLAEFANEISSYRFLGRDLHLDIRGQQPDGVDYQSPYPECRDEPAPLLDCDGGDRTVLYYNVIPANGRFYIDYWWFFRYNDFPRFPTVTSCTGLLREKICSDHEGDWEGITVVTSAGDASSVEYASYAAHTGAFRYANDQLQLLGDSKTHPAVYVAEGSHASYARRCKAGLCQQNSSGVVGLPDGRHNGRARWGRNSAQECQDGACLLHLPAAVERHGISWDAFRGTWGQGCPEPNPDCPLVAGPASPSQQPRYQAPYCSRNVLVDGRQVEKEPSCDGPIVGASPEATPGLPTGADCRSWAGPQVAILACDEDRLAQGLASAKPLSAPPIILRVRHRLASDAATAGVAQVLRPPLRPRTPVTVSGRVTRLIVRAGGQQASDGSLAPVVEASFDHLALKPSQRAVVRVHRLGARFPVTLELNKGPTIEPSVVADVASTRIAAR